MKIKINSRVLIALSLVTCGSLNCRKLTLVPEPVNTITTVEAFSTDATATSAIVGIYSDFLNHRFSNGSEFPSSYWGMSADELRTFGGPSRFETNTLDAVSGNSNGFWISGYYDIYLANAALEALPISDNVSPALKKQLSGEAEFFRAFFHFYLLNIYGDVPLVMSTSYRVNTILPRSSSSIVYRQIKADLIDAQEKLADDYSLSNGERIRVNRFGATALLARVYLYNQQWDSAEAQASSVIANNSLYQLNNDLNETFLANNSEAILQLQTPDIYPYATKEGNTFNPSNNTSRPNYYLTNQVLAAFESSDLRRKDWVDSTNFSGTTYYYPHKYKIFVGTQGNNSEYYMILRLAEQYLIRAEARAQQNNLIGAISDLNVIRERAGLSDLPPLLTQPELLAAVAQERRVEFFAEWGHRWLDLKRTGQADSVLGAIKPTWKPTAKLYPIPAPELINNANLTQNPGYN